MHIQRTFCGHTLWTCDVFVWIFESSRVMAWLCVLVVAVIVVTAQFLSFFLLVRLFNAIYNTKNEIICHLNSNEQFFLFFVFNKVNKNSQQFPNQHDYFAISKNYHRFSVQYLDSNSYHVADNWRKYEKETSFKFQFNWFVIIIFARCLSSYCIFRLFIDILLCTQLKLLYFMNHMNLNCVSKIWLIHKRINLASGFGYKSWS